MGGIKFMFKLFDSSTKIGGMICLLYAGILVVLYLFNTDKPEILKDAITFAMIGMGGLGVKAVAKGFVETTKAKKGK